MNRLIIITGANRGIGKETARALAKYDNHIIMACRNMEKSIPICEELKKGKQTVIPVKFRNAALRKELWETTEKILGIGK